MKYRNRTARLLLGASLGALAVSALPAMGLAQTTPATPANNVSVSDQNTVDDVIVVGARLAERSAIDRKKRAATAVDSIVADDVGQFPDKSAAEAIARIAGVALDISDSGEAGGFTIRGQTADLIRVEVDGMTTLNSTGDQGGRSAGLNELSSDLIKSVDVIKGSTADMTSGGVGGTVRIEQRNGLDFKKPLLRLNLQAQNSSLNSEWTPRVNVVAAGKFLDGRLGLLFNGTYDKAETTQDFARIGDKNAGYLPMGDYDLSEEKTFTTPYDPIAAAVTKKDDCKNLNTTTSTSNGTLNNRRNCYAQWEDYVPSLVRYGRGYRDDNKSSFQVRVDFRVSDNLTVFASVNPNKQKFLSKDFNLSIATPGPTGSGSASTDANGNRTTNFRALAVNDNHYITEYAFVRASASADPAAPVGLGTPQATVGDLNYTTQVRDIRRTNEQTYYQTGADFTVGKWDGKARLQYGEAENTRQDWAFAMRAPLDWATFSMIPGSGVWTFEAQAPGGLDLTDPAAFYAVPNTTTGISPNQQFDYIPQADKNSELAYQLDMTRDFDGEAGIFTRFKWGFQHREFKNETWREGGAFNLGNNVIQSRARALDQFRVCQAPAFTPIAPSATPPCTLGSVPNPNRGVSDQLYKLHSFTPEQYREIVDASIMPLPGGKFFGNLSDGDGLLDTWTVFNMQTFMEKAGQYVDLSDWNMDCLYNCIADDGETYKHRSYASEENTTSAYGMLDFESEVFGMALNGNIGVRINQIDMTAQTVLSVNNRTASLGTVDGRPGIVITNSVVSVNETTVDRSSRDALPSFNVALWPIEDQLAVRYSLAKQRARPSLTQLTGNSVVTCYNVDEAARAFLEDQIRNDPGLLDDGNASTDDETEVGNAFSSLEDNCSGNIGNPALKGYGAITQNLSLEWYPNRDTQISLAAYEISVESGRPRGVRDLAYVIENNPYTVNTYEDGEGGLKTRGFELSARTAFTFLPSILRHTGGGFNISTAKSTGGTGGLEYDILTGQFMPPKGESKNYYNINLWYDDGRVNARVAYQSRDTYFQDLAFEGSNRVGPPDGSYQNGVKVGQPFFRSKTRSLDARASLKLNEHVSFFAEGKNLLDNTQFRYTPEAYRLIEEGTINRADNTYVGRRYYVGLIYSF